MNPETWDRAKALLAEAAGRPASDREQYVIEHCADPALRAELLRMLATPASLTAIVAPPVLAPGSRLGAYVIREVVGSGGMGEVYRANDSRLGRDVAIKVLPPQWTLDRERLARFEREGRLLASLNHPHICTLFDVGTQDGTDYLVMEFVEGESLAARLAKGALPVEKAVRCGVQIADALDKAHARGIVHRDLKPANVMITAAGAKLLDFGLAKSRRAADVIETSPVDVTEKGALLGTRRYMAPEQVEGADADARSDIWALGCVLFEMLTGRPAFDARTEAGLAAAILEHVAPLLPPAQHGLDRVIRTCLAKSPSDRWQSAADVAIALQGAMESSAAERQIRGRNRLWTAAVVAGAVAVAATGVGVLWRVRSETPARAMRFSLGLPDRFASPIFMTMSADGRRIAFVDRKAPNESPVIWIRSLDTLEPQAVAGTEGEFQLPFWSADGSSIGFFADGKLKRADLASHVVQVICDAAVGRGGTWGPDGTIVFAPASDSALYRVSSSGGVPQALTTLDAARGDLSHRLPSFLPGGTRFVFTVLGKSWYGVALGSMDSRTTTMLMKWPADPRSPLEATQALVASGFLWFVHDRSLFAQRLDESTRLLIGEPLAITRAVALEYFGRQSFAVADDTVVYQPPRPSAQLQLTWVSREGLRSDSVGEPAAWVGLSISKDGRRVATARADRVARTSSVWVIDLARGLASRVTSDWFAADPLLSADGTRVYYSVSETIGRIAIYSSAVDGSGHPERVVDVPALNQHAAGWTADGSLIYQEIRDTGDGHRRYGLWKVPRTDPRHPALILDPGDQDIVVSHDGRLAAVVQGEDLFVQALAGGTRTHVAHGVADVAVPTWRADDRELFYVAAGKLMAVDVHASGKTEAGSPKTLFVYPDGAQDFVPSRDGRRFLIALPVSASKPLGGAELTVIVNATGVSR